jgi:hypothetical protein
MPDSVLTDPHAGQADGYPVGIATTGSTDMTQDGSEQLGRLDDAQEAAEPSSTTEGAAARGDYDPAEGSPGSSHPTGTDFPDEAVRYDEPGERRRSEQPDEDVED